jgi:hypothetical protein
MTQEQWKLASNAASELHTFAHEGQQSVTKILPPEDTFLSLADLKRWIDDIREHIHESPERIIVAAILILSAVHEDRSKP